MDISLEQLEAELLERSTRERARLAQVLIASLDRGAHEDPCDVERAWEEEIRKRLAEVDAGTATLIPAEQVFDELRNRPGK